MRLYLVAEEKAYPGNKGQEIQLEPESYAGIVAAENEEAAIAIGETEILRPAFARRYTTVIDLGDAEEREAGFVAVIESMSA